MKTAPVLSFGANNDSHNFSKDANLFSMKENLNEKVKNLRLIHEGFKKNDVAINFNIESS